MSDATHMITATSLCFSIAQLQIGEIVWGIKKPAFGWGGGADHTRLFAWFEIYPRA
jgi:hypothetical protein